MPDDGGQPDPDEWGDDESGDNPDIDWPPVWNILSPQSVPEDSLDYTLVYPNLKGQCIDRSHDVNVNIVSHSYSYDLEMVGDDLVIKNLAQDYWDNGKIVALTCNSVPSFFILTISPVNDAPHILNLDEIIVYTDEIARIDLTNYEYDVDNSHDELKWYYKIRWGSQSLFSVGLDGKILTITPRTVGTSYIKLKLEDPAGLYDEKDVRVKVIPRGYKRPSKKPKEEKDKTGISISSIRFNKNDVLSAGGVLEAFITIKNTGDVDLENIKITMLIQDIAARGSVGPFDLNDGRSATKMVLMDIEEGTAITEDMYDVRFTISNDNMRRVVHREVDVELI